MKVLGIVANTHDSGIALLRDGVPEFVLEEERFNRHKRTMHFPDVSLAAIVRERQFSLADVDAITVPWDVRRLRKTVFDTIVRGFPASLNLFHQRAHPAQRNQILVLNQYLKHGLRNSLGTRRLPPFFNIGHHDSHAAMFFVSPFEEALVLVMDGYGDDASSSAYTGKGNRLERNWRTDIFNSLGLVYTFVTEHLGFAGFGDEGKVMALAAYGGQRYTKQFRDVIRLTPDGGYAVNMDYFSYDTYGQIRPLTAKFIAAFGPRRAPVEPLTDRQKDVAFALQSTVETAILHVVRGLLKKSHARDLCMTGGVALNCVANARILEETDVRRMWVPPCASDTGAPLGSALWHYHHTLGHPRNYELTHPYLGTAYNDADIEGALRAAGLDYQRLHEADLLRRTARDLADGRIVGWFQGRFEIGPRALGNRSILADPRRAETKDILNRRIKQREPFRPFAPAVLAERANEFFEIDQPDPFMTLAPRVRTDKRALIPAAVHVDGTGRIQTVARDSNPRYHALIAEFARLTGVPVLLNTSFNRHEPIVAQPEEALACYLRAGIDTLVIGNFYTTNRQRDLVATDQMSCSGKESTVAELDRRALAGTASSKKAI
jgi:carbamoyltransferase